MLNPFSIISSYVSKKLQRREMRKKGLVQSKKTKRLKQDDGISSAVERSKILGVAILFLVWVACVIALMASPYDPMEFAPVLKQKAPVTVRTDFDFSYVDHARTAQARKRAEDAVPLTYRLNENACNRSIKAAKTIFRELPNVQNGTIPDSIKKEFPQSVKAYKRISPSLASVMNFLLQKEKNRNAILGYLEERLYRGILPEIAKNQRFNNIKIKIRKGAGLERPQSAATIPDKTEAVAEIVNKAIANVAPDNRNDIREILTTILSEVVRSNLVYDREATERDRKRVAANIAPIAVMVRKNSIITKKDEVIDQPTLDLCNAYLKAKYERMSTEKARAKFISSALLSLFLIAISGLYLSHVHPEIVVSNQKMGLVAMVVIITLGLDFLAVDVFRRLAAVFDLHPGAIFCAIPIALASAVLSVMIGLRVAFFAGLFISFITAMQLGNSFSMAINGMIVSSVVALTVRYRRNYKSYCLAAAGAVLVTAPIVRLVNVKIFFSDSWYPIPDIILTGTANALVVALLSLAVIFILEPIFQITSDMSLLVLCDFNHPLLRRLQLEAPGTYHHSLVVATLADQAATAIGANPIKARAVSLFHDIGKIEKPSYFTENQMSEESKHANLNPTMSALVIINHVKDGVNLAIKHKLKRIIRDGIEQHHGTDLVAYFYHEALEEARQKNNSINESDFRYPGPLPKEKEVAILSLADACEAASRSLQKPTPAKIEALVWEIMRKRIRSGQLDEADLTFGELAKVRKSFTATLTTMMHGRIAYPKDDEDKNEDELFLAAREQTQAKHKKAKKDSA